MGCAIYRLSLAVHDIIRSHDAIIHKVNKVVQKTANTYFKYKASEFHGVESLDIQ